MKTRRDQISQGKILVEDSGSNSDSGEEGEKDPSLPKEKKQVKEAAD